jgi:LmbE family N-acetylglucosaminyl deacetylase
MNMLRIYAKSLLLFFGCLVAIANYAQTPATYTSADIYLQLKKLKVLGSVLYVAAHPDDENTRLLAYFSKDKLYRTGYLSITRGDGGQNLIGDEQGVDLGLIRTQELLSARRIDGAEQFFTRAYDFGFSKSTDEAMKIWDKQKILSDVVWVIRKFQPDVIITRFPEDARAGHGHHSGSAVLAHEAFKLAGDPNAFPEQFKYGVTPWQPKRIVWNTFNFGGTNTTSNDQLKLDVGAYNPILGKGYGEIAAESRSQHKSQGFGVPAARGPQIEFFTPVEGQVASKDLYDDVNTSWSRVEGGEEISKQIDELISNFKLSNPELTVPGLLQLNTTLSKMKDSYWKTQKLQEVNKLIETCSGLWMEASANNQFAVQGDSIRVQVNLINRLGADAKLLGVSFDGFDTTLQKKLETNASLSFTKSVYVSPTKALTQPYWLEQKMNEGSFNVTDQNLIGKPENSSSYEATFKVLIGGQEFNFRKPIRYRFTDPVKGELYQPLTVMPAVSVSTDPGLIIFRKNNQEQNSDLVVHLTANKNFDKYKLKVSKKIGTENNSQTDSSFSLAKGLTKDFYFTLNNKTVKDKEQDQVIAVAELKNGKEAQPASLSLTTIRYDHIPYILHFYQDAVKVLNIDLKTEGKRIGYIEGAGDKIPEALEEMGYDVVMLKERDIYPAYLKQFDAIITGVRAYNVNDYMARKYDALMTYVKEGGNLIVQYNTINFVSNIRSKIGPYPFNISRNRVTDEKAKVKFLLPDHPVLNYPNKITDADFDGWIQERGIYHADQIDSVNYQTPLSMADPGEAEQKGSLIIADYGRGKFVYTGLVFFRELPAAVPGAYRLLANIIALNKKKAF